MTFCVKVSSRVGIEWKDSYRFEVEMSCELGACGGGCCFGRNVMLEILQWGCGVRYPGRGRGGRSCLAVMHIISLAQVLPRVCTYIGYGRSKSERRGDDYAGKSWRISFHLGDC